MDEKGDFHPDCKKNGPLRRRVKTFLFLFLPPHWQQKGSQDSRAGNNFPPQFGDPTNTKEALEELHPEQHKGRISYVIGWIYTFHVKYKGGPSQGTSFCGEGAGSETPD